ncbi:MAG TPA: extracellular solute-binding protein [Bryobacteraceae bacterium]|nr:extracellular solute-binding protein [Bryobacteraceae bacterium]
MPNACQRDAVLPACGDGGSSGARWRTFIPLLAAAISLTGCARFDPETTNEPDPTILTITSLGDGPIRAFELRRFTDFAASRKNVKIRYIPAFESFNLRLELYQRLLKDRSPQPDILEIDVIWPGLLGDDLLDLTPYFRNQMASFPPDLLQTYTVHGRLIAIPLYVDSGVLYYRSDLLRKYGFSGPPETWDDLERMSKVIQSGERRLGHANFWGYVWQGNAGEALTCNGLEWQASQGGGHIIEPDGTITVGNAAAVRAVERAVSWIGVISPPGTTAYIEDDALNTYAAGNAAFMRNWSSMHESVRSRSHFGETAAALLPAGKSGHGRTLGGIAISVSKYSEHRDEAVAALRDLVSADSQSKRALALGITPTLLALAQSPELMRKTPFHGELSGQALSGLQPRPSVVAGRVYDQVSRAYYQAVHSALTRAVPPPIAMARLQTELERIVKTK